MDISRAVLVVVDMQQGFVHPNSAYVVPRVVDLVKRWSDAGGALLFTRFQNWSDSPFERFFNWSALMSSPQTDLVPELEPYAATSAMVDKPFYTPFTAEGESLISANGWTDLVICGLTTESCVLKTAVDTFERHLTPWVVADACATHAGQQAHEAGLLVLSRFIGRGQIVTLADLALSPGALEITADRTPVVHNIVA
ncbi:isochorismatase family cysteine hydrolase [Catellatospora chokoriensis]|uniref:Hydrolase n=1 Tax=Catellatospora chokoriensis TaxID=310353 RepID=A0A8J3K2T7_9ACTN|nr:isochorismatase family cysteine hydrolase [Catellatospora chokoriensis]GIF91387.1 hydrolase [Catellatospora chokoriensis]